VDQLTLKDVEVQEKQGRARALAAELDRRLKAVALGLDRHDFAAINDKSYSYMCEILNTNNEDGQKPFQAKFIPSLIIESPEAFKEQVIDFLCELTGHKPPEKKSPLSAEEELELIKRKIKSHGLEALFRDLGGGAEK
jgi:hypothetical protein